MDLVTVKGSASDSVASYKGTIYFRGLRKSVESFARGFAERLRLPAYRVESEDGESREVAIETEKIKGKDS